jgi:hypothetical protein
MASKSNIYNNLSIGSTTNTSATFNVNNTSGENVITVDPDGYCVINKLALLDDVTGKKWEVRISGGEILVEPIELEDKREHKLNKIFK